MSTAGLSSDTRAVVRAAEQLAAEVRRVADALTTTAVDTRRKVRPITLATPCAACTHPYNWHKAGVCQVGDETNRCGCIAFAVEAPAADEDALRAARRDSLDILLARAERVLPPAEAAMLREHITKETREHDTMRAVAAGNKRHVQAMYADLQQAHAATEEQRQRADIAQTELRVLRAGLRANGADPTQIQNLWAQIRLRNRQWREAKGERDEAQAAVERVRGECAAIERDMYGAEDDGMRTVIVRVLAALDSTEQSSTKEG